MEARKAVSGAAIASTLKKQRRPAGRGAPGCQIKYGPVLAAIVMQECVLLRACSYLCIMTVHKDFSVLISNGYKLVHSRLTWTQVIAVSM